MWVEVGRVEDLRKRKRIVVTHEDHEILVLVHDGHFHALANRCIHRDRELVKGVVLRNKLVCPGHQWAFELDTGWENVKQECQPVYTVTERDGSVFVDPDSCRTVSVPDPTGSFDT